MDFGNKLQNLRKNKGLSQEQLADKLNVSRQAVSKWESNASYPEMDKIIAICKLFDCSIDELLNTKNKRNIENNKIINYLNSILNFISKSISMFLSMTFKQKIKCIFEMILIIFLLITIMFGISMLLKEIFYNISDLLPREIYIVLLSLGNLIYKIFSVILSSIIFIHLFKTRYLDYYTIIDKENDNESSNTQNNAIEIQKDKKIIIRDPKDSTISIMKFVKKCFNILLKFISLILIFFGSMSFVFLIAMITIIIWYITNGPIFIGSLVLTIGIILINYILLQILYKFVTNKKQNIKVIFIISIISLALIGSGFGIGWYSYSKFEIKELEYNYLTKTKIIDFKNNMSFEDSTVYKIDNNLKDKIKIEIKYIDKYDVELEKENHYTSLLETNYTDFYYGNINSMSFIDEFNYLIKTLKNKEIINYKTGEFKIYYITVYGNKNNLEIIKENNLKLEI